MTATLGIALLSQLLGIAALRHRLGRAWLLHPVTVLYLFAVVNQGLSGVALSFGSIAAADPYRQGVAPGYEDTAALLTAGAMLAFVAGYLLTQLQRAQSAAESQVPAMPDWRLLAATCVPLAWLTYDGKGYNATGVMSPSTPLATVLASSFFILLVILAAFSFTLARGPHWFLPALAAQSLVLAAAGERIPVVTGAVALAVLLNRAGMRPPRAQVHAALALTAVAVLAVTGARAVAGRGTYETATGLGARAQALGSGLPSAGSLSGLIASTAVRMDGEAFTAAVLQGEALGHPRLSAAGIPQSLLVAVPSALWPSKLAHGAWLDTVDTETAWFGLRNINFLPTLPGLYAGFLPWPWLIVFMAFLGAVWGRSEKWLLRAPTAARFVLVAGAITVAMGYQGGLPGMVVALRTAAVIAVAVWALERVRSRWLARVLEAAQP